MIFGIDVYSCAINQTVKPYLRPDIRNGLIFLNSFLVKLIKSSNIISLGLFFVSSSNSSYDGISSTSLTNSILSFFSAQTLYKGSFKVEKLQIIIL